MTNKIEQMQMIEQSIHSLITQKQQFSAQLMETKGAKEELEKTDVAYKIIGSVMIKTEKSQLLKELNDKEEMTEIRIKSIEKQENSLKEKAQILQKEILQEMSDKNGQGSSAKKDS